MSNKLIEAAQVLLAGFGMSGKVKLSHLKIGLLFLAFISSAAHAGLISFAAGAAVGHAMTNKDCPAPLTFGSDKYDVIACKESADTPHACLFNYQSYTVEQYAAQAGYKTVVKTSVAVSGDTRWIIIEVKK